MRQALTHDAIGRYIEASPEALYDVIADVTQTPDLSPEVVACEWLDGATAPAVGVRFRAKNHAGRGPGTTHRSSPSPSAAGSSRSPAPRKLPARSCGGTCSLPRRAALASPSPTKSPGRCSCSGGSSSAFSYRNRDRQGDLRRGMTLTLQRLAALTEKTATRS